MASESPPVSSHVDNREWPSYLTLRKSLSGAGLKDRPSVPRTRSRSDTWSQSRTNLRHDGDPRSATTTHCWHCGAASLPQMATFREKASTFSPFHLPPLSQSEPVEVRAPPVSADSQPHALDGPSSTASLSQTDKLMRMKDAMLDATDIPVIALWHDESLAVPNKAVARIMHFDTDPVSENGDDVLSRYRIFTEDFERELEQPEFPLVRLCRTQQPFSRVRVGIMDSQMRQKVYEVVGQCVYDERSGEFQAAVCALKDVTWYTELLKVQSEQNEQNEQQFQLICETLPQMVCSWISCCLGM